MGFQELLSEIRKRPLQELRASTEKYFEAVVSMTTLVGVEELLIAYFGVPMKPAGVHPCRDAHRVSEPYGGIRSTQTMYFRKRDVGHEVAFLWPWHCGTLVTLKIIVEDQARAGAAPSAQKASGIISFLKSLFGKN
jgi:hypothetical protein